MVLEIIMLCGSGALTLCIVEALTNQKQNGITSIIETLAYALIDSVLTIFMGQAIGVLSFSSENRQLHIGTVALLIAVFVSVVMGILISIIKAKISIRLETKEK